jgi:hypothetical protein
MYVALDEDSDEDEAVDEEIYISSQGDNGVCLRLRVRRRQCAAHWKGVTVPHMRLTLGSTTIPRFPRQAFCSRDHVLMSGSGPDATSRTLIHPVRNPRVREIRDLHES